MLALSLGMSVKRCQKEVDSREFSRWIAFFERYAFGPVHEDLRFGYLASLLFNANRAKDAEAMMPEDFFKSLKHAKPKKTVEELKLEFMLFVAQTGGIIVQGGEVFSNEPGSIR